MQYNLALYSQSESNTVVGNVDVNTYDLTEILRVTTASAIAIYDDDILCIDVDLGTQIEIDEIRYYFNSTSASGAVASGVEFFHKQEDFEVYISLDTFTGYGYYYTTITSGTSHPRYIRLKHTVSGTAVSGTVAGFEVYNDDTTVDFGDDGTKVSENIELAALYDTEDIKEVHVYNSGDQTANAFIMLEPQYTDIDDYLSISASADGPWLPARQTDNEICGPNTWDYGNSLYTELLSDRILLEPTALSGTYETRIFTTLDTQKFTFLNLRAEYPSSTEAVAFSEDFSGSPENRWADVGTGDINYSSGAANLENANAEIQSINDIEFGYQWEVIYRVKVSAAASAGTRFYLPYSGSTTGCVYFHLFAESFMTNSWTLRFYVEDTIEWSSGLQVEYNKFYDDWGWVKIRREANMLYFKYWSDPDSEPGWVWSDTIGAGTINTSGKIWMTNASNWISSTFYDDITIRTNLDATGKIGKIAVDETDTQETIGIRISNQNPTDYLAYKKIWYDSENVYIRDYWVHDDSLIRTSDAIHTGSVTSLADSNARFYVDLNTRKTAVVYRWEHEHAHVGNHLELAITDADGSLINSFEIVVNDGVSADYLNQYALYMDASGGVWWYAFSRVEADQLNDGEGYYLIRYDADLNETFRLFSDDSYIYDMDQVYATGDLWYTDFVNNQAVKLDPEGNVLASFAFNYEIKGITTTTDGGCWVVQGDSNRIHKLDTDGGFEYTITPVVDSTASLSRVALDGDGSEYLWITDNTTVKHMFLDGRIHFTVDVENSPAELHTYETGVAVFCIDRSWRFISTGDQRIIRTIYNTDSNNIQLGVDGASVNSTLHASEFPVPHDQAWPLLPWNKVVVDHYNIPQDKYCQIRFRLWRDNISENSPELIAMYLNESILVEDVGPNNYETIYLKADIGAEDITGSYDSTLKSWWYVPIT